MSDSKNPPIVNGASHPDPLAEYNARAAALRASLPGAHISPDPYVHLENARAIADLVFVACGCCTDGRDSSIDELAPTTLSAAAFCILQEIDTARTLQDELNERERLRKVDAANKGSAAH
jgi:hypothetical protein